MSSLGQVGLNFLFSTGDGLDQPFVTGQMRERTRQILASRERTHVTLYCLRESLLRASTVRFLEGISLFEW